LGNLKKYRLLLNIPSRSQRVAKGPLITSAYFQTNHILQGSVATRSGCDGIT